MLHAAKPKLLSVNCLGDLNSLKEKKIVYFLKWLDLPWKLSPFSCGWSSGLTHVNIPLESNLFLEVFWYPRSQRLNPAPIFFLVKT